MNLSLMPQNVKLNWKRYRLLFFRRPYLEIPNIFSHCPRFLDVSGNIHRALWTANLYWQMTDFPIINRGWLSQSHCGILMTAFRSLTLKALGPVGARRKHSSSSGGSKAAR